AAVLEQAQTRRARVVPRRRLLKRRRELGLRVLVELRGAHGRKNGGLFFGIGGARGPEGRGGQLARAGPEGARARRRGFEAPDEEAPPELRLLPEVARARRGRGLLSVFAIPGADEPKMNLHVRQRLDARDAGF